MPNPKLMKVSVPNSVCRASTDGVLSLEVWCLTCVSINQAQPLKWELQRRLGLHYSWILFGTAVVDA
jgi:hypothetical protein